MEEYDIKNTIVNDPILYSSNIASVKKFNLQNASLLAETEQLAQINCKKDLIVGDGNCFFRAISHQLYKKQKRHLQIRSCAIKQLRSNPNHYAPFLNNSTYPNINDYINKMALAGTDADHPVIVATANRYKTNIIVHELGKEPLSILQYDSNKRQFHVWYDPVRGHYDSILTLNNHRLILHRDQ